MSFFKSQNILLKKHLLLCVLLISSCVMASQKVNQWQFQTEAAIYASPMHHEGTIYVGSLDKSFYAIEAQTGSKLWSFKTKHPIHSTVAIHEGIICFESGNILYALDLQGQLLWQFKLCEKTVTNQIDSWDFHHSSPRIVDGVAYIGTEQGYVWGVHVLSGTEVFKWQTPTRSTIRISPEIYDNKLFVGDWIGVLFAYDLEEKALAWKYDTRKDNTYGWSNAIQTPLVFKGEDVFFAGRSCNAYSLNVKDGSRNWLYNDPNVWIVGGTVLHDGQVFFGSSNQRKFYSLDAETGEERWIGNLDHRIWGAPVVVGSEVFVGAASFFALDASKGNIVNRIYFDADEVHPDGVTINWAGSVSSGGASDLANIHSSVISDGESLYFGCDDGILYAVNARGLVEKPHPETVLENDSNLILGDISAQDEPFSIDIELTNQGEGSDIVYLSISGTQTPEGALVPDASKFELKAGESNTVSLTINPALMELKKYRLTVGLLSTQGLVNVNLRKKIIFTIVQGTGVEAEKQEIPTSCRLLQNYPNPFNPQTRIDYRVDRALGPVSLSVHDVRGRLIKRLVSEAEQGPGEYHVTWAGIDDAGQPAASGTYVVRLIAEETIHSRKILLMR